MRIVSQNGLVSVPFEMTAIHATETFIRMNMAGDTGKGTVIAEYSTLEKVEKAIQLLVQTDKKLIDICLESGFSESKYFNKIFSRDYHMKPKEFRQMARNSWGRAVPDFERQGRTFYSRQDCLAILRSYFHYTCDEPPDGSITFFEH